VTDFVFGDLHSLVYLKMQYNGIDILSTTLFESNTKLMFLYLSRNNLSKIEGTFSKLQNLTLLYLHENVIGSITAYTFANCTSLVFVCLRQNLLQRVYQTAFVNISSRYEILYLDISFSRLIDATELQQSLFQIPYLQILNLEKKQSQRFSGECVSRFQSC
jgi:Leucine-rich repeat (LRR) protein